MAALLHRLLTGARFTGIEIELRSGGPVFHVTVLKQEGKKIIVEKCAFNIKDIEQLKATAPKGMFAAVTLTGKGIVHRIVEARTDQSDQVVLSKVLPGASLSEFAINRVFLSEHKQCVGIIRKQECDDVLRLLEEIPVIATAVGVGIVNRVLPLLIGYGAELRFGHHTIRFKEGIIAEVLFDQHAKVQDDFVIAKETIPAFNIVSFALALTGIADKNNEASYLSINDTLKQQYLAKRKMKLGMGAGLGLFLLILLANFLLFNHYRGVKIQLEADVAGMQVTSEELEQLRSKVSDQQSFLEGAGLIRRTSFGWIADRLASEMPNGILLDRMNFSPRQKFAEADTIGFESGKLVMTGQVTESIILNDWLQHLQTMAWIDSVQIVNYSAGKSSNGYFEIEVAMK